ncbi:MAG TPA: S41 family peptidase [Candidatus Paceibacterota bacterium]|nr:S41 family peptidase [Candidatus Paceibacterota bacterium]HMP18728.1 S41 family peptidase [Candidatus Paceibacterota bacterium]
MKKILKDLSLYSASIIVALIVFFSGFFAGNFNQVQNANISNNSVNASTEADLSEFWRVWRILNEKYKSSNENNVSDKDKIYGAIKGMVDSLGDPYTHFLTPEEKKNFETSIQGEFFGVGMEISSKEKMIVVVSPLKNTPAEKAGILADDVIVSIDGVPTLSMGVDDAVSRIRGPAGTKVKLNVYRKSTEQNFDVEIVREKINIPTLETKVVDDVFVISLYNFSANSTSQFRNALREFTSSRKNKLILDLRGNPGGFLEASVDIASWFLPAGKVVVKEDFGSSEKVFRSKGYNIFSNRDLKMVVLVNKGSASASEILAGALSEYGIAKIVGTNTFGKGSVQELIQISKDTSLKVTVAQWLTPNGVSISEGGLKPDLVVDTAPDGVELMDYQFQKAIELLNTI